MNWPVELKEAVRERVGGRGLTPFVISAVEAKLGTHDEHKADSKELNEVKFLAQRLADTIAMRSDYEDPESTLRELDLPPWVDTTGWPEELARAINPEESTPEPVAPYVDTRDDITEQMDDLAEQEAMAYEREYAQATEARIPDDFQSVGMIGDDGGVFSKGEGDRPGVGDVILSEPPKTSHSNDLFTRLTEKAAEKGVDISGVDLKPASSIERPEVKTLTAEEAGFKLETEEKAEPVHNHSWARMEDPHGLYDGQAYVCDCGATMDSRRVYQFGELPGPKEVQVPTEVAVPLEVPAEEPTPVAASDVCPKCQQPLVAGECWECF
jgi:hypothetical protein